MKPYSSKRDASISLYLTKCSKIPDEDNEDEDEIDERDEVRPAFADGESELANLLTLEWS
jgi:hypothetical protein